MIRTVVPLLLLSIGACIIPPSEGGDRNVVTTVSGDEALGLAVDSIALEAVDRGEVVGLTVAVLDGGGPIRVKGYGTADLERFASATDSTRYYIGSITKTVTAAAILALVDQGLVSLDDDVFLYVPELEDSEPSITLRHLLNHTSGLAGPQEVAGKFLERRHLEFSRDQLLELLLAEPRVSAPGERFAYNNLGYLVLGIVLERVSGRSFEEQLLEGVVGRSPTSSLLLCDSRRVIPHRATGYVAGADAVVHHEPVNVSLVFAAGGLCGTAGDVARWLRKLATGAIVSSSALEQMITPARLADGSALEYGYGVVVGDLAGYLKIHHGGDVNGFSSHAAHYLDRDLTVVVLTNTRSPAARRIEQQIASLVLGISRAGA